MLLRAEMNNNIYLWVTISFTCLFITYLSYGFIKDLFFWRDDFTLLYQLSVKELANWPYQGINIIYFPFYLLFGINPQGYFFLALLLYATLAIMLVWFTYKITENLTLGFITGCIFASGFIGSDAMLMIGISIASLLYILVTFLFIVWYKNIYRKPLFDKQRIIFIVFYTIVIFLFSHRAFTLLPSLLIIHLYLFFVENKKLRSQKRDNITNIAMMVILTIVTLCVYVAYPKLIIQVNNGSSHYLLTQILNFLNLKTMFGFFSAVGNFVIPQSAIPLITQVKQFTPSNIVIFATTLIFGFHILSAPKIKKVLLPSLISLCFSLLAFVAFKLFSTQPTLLTQTLVGILFILLSIQLAFEKQNIFRKYITLAIVYLFIISYFIYYIKEPSVLPNHRYLIFGLPYSSLLIALLIQSLTEKLPRIPGILVLSLLTAFIVKTNVQLIQSLKEPAINRSYNAKSFFDQLKRSLPHVTNKTLLYLDVAADSQTQGRFGDILRVGYLPTEAAIAGYYNVPLESIKLTYGYDDFLSEVKKPEYKSWYTFFYTKENILLKTKNDIIKPAKTITLNLSQAQVLSPQSKWNTLSFDRNTLTYKTIIYTDKKNSNSTNDLLIFNTPPFPSQKPIELEIKMRIVNAIQKIRYFPYHDREVTIPPNNIQLDYLDHPKTLLNLISYNTERLLTIKKLKVSSSGDEGISKSTNIIDKDLKTAWSANRKQWILNNHAYIQIDLERETVISEVRWYAAQQQSIPTSYHYQSFNEHTQSWTTIKQYDKYPEANTYIIDTLDRPILTRKIRMVINKTTATFPSISEIELLSKNYQADSRLSDFLEKYPLFLARNPHEAKLLFNGFKLNQKIFVYPISDKYFYRNEEAKTTILPSWDDKHYHTHKFVLPAGGTKINQILIEFPNVPLEANIQSAKLTEL